MYARTSVAVLLAFAAYAAAKSSSSSTPSVDDFGFLSQSDFPEDFSLNKAQAKCFESIARTKTLNALTAAGESSLTCSGMKNLCSQCSSCDSFSTDPTQRCVCLTTDTAVTLTQKNSCLLVPLSSALAGKEIQGSSMSDCIIVAGSRASLFYGNEGDDVLISVNTGTNDMNGALKLSGGAGDDCVVADGFVGAYAYGDEGDDVVFQGSDAEFTQFSYQGGITDPLIISGGAGDDLVLISGQAYTVSGGDGDDIVIVKNAAVAYVSEDTADVDVGDDFVHIAGKAFVRINLNAHGGDNTIIVDSDAVVGNIGGGPDGMTDDNKIYIYGGVLGNVELDVGADYVYVGKSGHVGGSIIVPGADAAGDEIIVEGVVEADIDLGDGDNKLEVGTFGYVGGYFNGGAGIDEVKVEGVLYEIFALGGDDKVAVGRNGHVNYIQLEEGNDKIVISGVVEDVEGGAGDDAFILKSGAHVLSVVGGDGADEIKVESGARVGQVYGNAGIDSISIEGFVAGGVYGGAGIDNIHVSTDATAELVVDTNMMQTLDIVRIDDPNYKKLVKGQTCYVANEQIRVDCDVVIVASSSSSSNEADSVSDASILKSSFTVRSD